MSKVKILVVEDEVIIADNLCFTLESLGYQVGEPAASYYEAVEMLEEETPDFAIIDIQLSSKKTGIDLARHIQDKYDFPFVFLTSNSDKLTFDEAKLVEPSAFLVKPYGKEEIYNAIELALYNFSKKKESHIDKENIILDDSLFVKHKQCFVRIEFKEIQYIQSDSVYLDIYMINGKKYTVRGSLNEYISRLNKHFVRCHRSYIINTLHLEKINHITATVHGEDIPIGKKYREELLAGVKKG